jgi:hypothetical protein
MLKGVPVRATAGRAFRHGSFKPLLLLAPTIALGAVGPPVAAAQPMAPITTLASQDATINQRSPATASAGATTLTVDRRPSTKAFLAFNVTGLGMSAPASATLRMYVTKANSKGFTVSSWGDGDWMEGISWNYYLTDKGYEGRPAAAARVVRSGSWVDVDVTKLVDGDGLTSLVLNSADAETLRFASREAAGHEPRLVMVPSKSPVSGAFAWPPMMAVTAVASSDPVVAAIGDVACDPWNAAFNGGLGNGKSCRQAATATTIAGLPNLRALLFLGDNQYYCGSNTAFMSSFDPTFKRFRALYRPAVGNHEYITTGGGIACDASNANAAGYFRYFGAAAGAPGQGWYSFDVGSWHFVALNSNCSKVGGCGATSPQGRWLAADLAANASARCTAAFFHHPLFSDDTSGGHASASAVGLWQTLYDGNADVVLNGHSHIYERYPAMTPQGAVDRARGIVEFIAGTGGANHTPTSTSILPRPLASNNSTFGALSLTLHAASATYRFVPSVGTFTETGEVPCH